MDEVGLLATADSTTNGNLTTLQGTVTTLQGTVTTVQGNVTTNTGNISALQTLTSTHTSDITNLQSSVGSLSGSAVTLTGIQTITNKTLTAPTINLPVINGFTGNTTAINIGSNQFVKDTAGNIGLGIATPVWKLDVAGTNPGIRVKDGSNTSGVVIQQVASGNAHINLIDNRDLILNTNNTERIRVTAAGVTQIAGQVTATGVQTSGQVGVGKAANANLDYRESVENISVDTTAIQSRTYIVLASSTVTLPSTPTVGDWVKIINSSDTTTVVIARNG